MIKTEKLFEDFRKYTIEETGADCAEDEEEVYEGGARQIANLSKKQKAEMEKEPEPAKKEKVDESPRYGEEYADMDGEEPQGNDNPSQDVYTMIDKHHQSIRGLLQQVNSMDDDFVKSDLVQILQEFDSAVLQIVDKMDANPEMTDTKYPEPPMAEKLSEGKKTIKLKINSKKKK